MSEKIRRENPYEERINNPANPSHYWQYRMHITLEELVNEKEYNTELEGYIKNSGRL
jgi:4-alpha-glucanotransferase